MHVAGDWRMKLVCWGDFGPGLGCFAVFILGSNGVRGR